MFFIQLLTLLFLAISTLAAPTPTASFDGVAPQPASRAPQTPGKVTLNSGTNFGGAETTVNAMDACVFVGGLIKSLKQQSGAVCRYYHVSDCTTSNHVPVLRLDSTREDVEVPDLGAWAEAIRSLKCWGSP
ncbi:hypothetical protein BU23DRAFT_563026 [Bimuria novae-zelandiae CBS 107.79]|uniref:Uncharacterized protein n=1 Tax=Bimuria novae-zelandiae CBS 107.79 TaxID=1447943 RepID=A0A6A5VSQ2_9PLEO|nr:hypothetical protein BU23DRAFT_563026 [Bimuria novae-zelandiae CBS 107.79]